jgi:hypothetical protein
MKVFLPHYSLSGASKALLYASSQASSALCGTLADALYTLASGATGTHWDGMYEVVIDGRGDKVQC